MPIQQSPVALVTGASSGIGKDFALRLLTEGYAVYAAARRVERMADLASAGCGVIALDVTNDASMVATVDQIIGERGRIDVLINNAGYGQYGALEDVPMDEGRRQLETNLIGPARLIQLSLPHMRAQRYGRISPRSAGSWRAPLGGWYHASKFALEGYSDALRNEVSRFGIDVVVIEPGGIESEWSSIACDEAERYSGQGAYADFAAKFRKLQAQLGKSPPPSIISDLIVKALKAKRPATRYHGGRLASTLLFLRRVLPDRMLDALILSAFR
jgi:NAD(P)-dependent dehydrogenase (short-subunit alcohol dehydrogenase family)